MLILVTCWRAAQAPTSVADRAKALREQAWEETRAWQEAHGDDHEGSPSDGPHPAAQWAPKLWQFGRRHLEHEEGRSTATNALFLFQAADQGDQATDLLMSLPLDDPLWEDALGVLPFLHDAGTVPTKLATERAVSLWESSQTAATRFAAAIALGDVWLSEDIPPERARAWYQRALDVAEDDDHAERARARIYEIDHLQVGQVLPAFTTRALEGGPISDLDLRGRYAIVHVWSSWCVFCRESAPTLVDLRARYSPGDLALLGVNVDEERSLANETASSWEFEWSQAFEEGAMASSIARRFNVRSLPLYYLQDRDGTILEKGSKLEPIIAQLESRMDLAAHRSVAN